MSEWWESPHVMLHRRETCWYCEAALSPPAIFMPEGGCNLRGIQRAHAIQCCALCFMHESARVEARDECRKFVDIEYERCVCGRAQVSLIGECITCHRERRMLDRQWAEIKLARRILTSIRKEIKVGKQALDGRPEGASV